MSWRLMIVAVVAGLVVAAGVAQTPAVSAAAGPTTAVSAAAGPTTAATAAATAAWGEGAAKMEFDVASVKQNKSSDEATDSNFPLASELYFPNGGSLVATNFPLIVYIQFAYKINGNQRQALEKQLPGWVSEDRFDVAAKTDKHDATKDEMRLMMRSLLADRFALAAHVETQQVAVYGLALAKPGTLGPKLRVHPGDSACTNEAGAGAKETVAGGYPSSCGAVVGLPSDVPGRLILGARNVTMGVIANTLTGPGHLGRPVIDRTGLTAKYDFVLEFAQEAPAAQDPASAPADSGPVFEQALKEQLGLKLEAQKAPVDAWIVDHVEHPTEN